MRARRAGDAALLLQAGGAAGALAAAIVSERCAGVLDVVPGAQTVLVITEPGRVDLDDLAARLLALPLPGAQAGAGALAEIPVVYDGPDLAEVARLTGLSAGEVVARHAGAQYRVGWLGFSPGFGYLTGLDPVLAAVPRLDEPRLRVPAGAVAIAGGLAAVYSSTSPGGWRLLGRTPAVLWDPRRDPPSLLSPGMRVRFRAVDSAPPAASRPAAPAQLARPGDGPVIEVVRPGPLATVQDLGRPGFGHLGVPRAGAADQASLRLANRLVGNPDGAAGLELTLGRAALFFHRAARVALTGAPAAVTVTGPDGSEQAGAEPAAMFEVPAGGTVRVGAPAAGLRSYLAVRGGIDVPPVLGSRSADLLSGLGPPPLRAGDLLPVGAPGPAAAARPADGPRAAVLPAAGQPAELRVIPGPRDDWFAAGALDLLCGGTYVVTTSSDRTGLRLDGPALPRAHGDELPSEGVVTGALQVPPGGRPILLLADHPVTGGYPVIAVVASADIGLAGQLRPGAKIRFVRGAGPGNARGPVR
jgi:KipI family sensor histidine kinase inhibitor